MKLIKYLIGKKIDSRRACERFIKEGNVTVNGKIIKNILYVMDETNDAVKVNGKNIKDIKVNFIYILMNKPKGYISSTKDDKKRATVIDLVKKIKGWKTLFPVGRLDYNTEGILILTNDGEFANNVIHPSKKIVKTYIAKIRTKPKKSQIDKLIQKGIFLEGKKVKVLSFKIIKDLKVNCWVEIQIISGIKHVIKEICKKIGCPVIYLKREGIGGLKLRNFDIAPGQFYTVKKEFLEDFIFNKK